MALRDPRFEALAVRAATMLPRPVVRVLSPATAGVVRDQAAVVFAAGRLGWPALEHLTPPAARAEARRESRVLAGVRRQPPAGVAIEVPGAAGALAARLHVPPGVRDPVPLLVWFHGGGWTVGEPDSHDRFLALLAREAEVRVLAPTYRLAPEHPFPAAWEDAMAVLRWALSGAGGLCVDGAGRVAVGGDSAGGNLAASLAAALRGAPIKPGVQVLLYPVTDVSSESGSYTEFEHGPWLTATLMRWFRHNYIPTEAQARDARASPLLAPELRGVPPTYLGIGDVDPLRDEAIAYGERLRRAGVDVTVERFPGHLHGYAELIGVAGTARAAALRAARWLRDRHA